MKTLILAAIAALTLTATADAGIRTVTINGKLCYVYTDMNGNVTRVQCY